MGVPGWSLPVWKELLVELEEHMSQYAEIFNLPLFNLADDDAGDDASDDAASQDDDGETDPEMVIFSRFMARDGRTTYFSTERFLTWLVTDNLPRIRAVMKYIEDNTVAFRFCCEDIQFDKDEYDDRRAYRLAVKVEDGIILDWPRLTACNDLRRARGVFKMAVVLLGMHMRAARSANHPDRKRRRGEFDVDVACEKSPTPRDAYSVI